MDPRREQGLELLRLLGTDKLLEVLSIRGHPGALAAENGVRSSRERKGVGKLTNKRRAFHLWGGSGMPTKLSPSQRTCVQNFARHS